MRLVLLTSSLTGGGAEKALSKIAAGLAARDHQIDFIVCENAQRNSGAYAPPAGCRFHVLASSPSHSWLGKRYLAWRLRKLLADSAPDLVVSTLPFADEVAMLAHVPHHVCRIANTLSAEIERLPRSKAARREKRYRTLYGSRRVVAVSFGVADDLRSHFGVDDRNLRVIANPFDISGIRAQANAACAGRPAPPYILHVGRYAPQKRHDLLLDAFATLDTPRTLVLLTPPNAALAEQISMRGLEERVLVAGFQTNPYPWMAGAELLVLCSDHEGLPNVLVEALACGTRVVSTDCPSGPREILSAEFAHCLVPCGEPAALAAAMRAVLAGPRPDPESVDRALEPYASDRALDAWEALAREMS